MARRPMYAGRDNAAMARRQKRMAARKANRGQFERRPALMDNYDRMRRNVNAAGRSARQGRITGIAANVDQATKPPRVRQEGQSPGSRPMPATATFPNRPRPATGRPSRPVAGGVPGGRPGENMRPPARPFQRQDGDTIAGPTRRRPFQRQDGDAIASPTQRRPNLARPSFSPTGGLSSALPGGRLSPPKASGNKPSPISRSTPRPGMQAGGNMRPAVMAGRGGAQPQMRRAPATAMNTSATRRKPARY